MSGFIFFFFGSIPGSGGATVGGGATLTPTTGGGSSEGLISFLTGWEVYSLGAELTMTWLIWNVANFKYKYG